MKIKTFTQSDYIKANRRASRLEEIENHQHPIRFTAVHKSKKVYNRKLHKAETKKALPYLFLSHLYHLYGDKLKQMYIPTPSLQSIILQSTKTF